MTCDDVPVGNTSGLRRLVVTSEGRIWLGVNESTDRTVRLSVAQLVTPGRVDGVEMSFPRKRTTDEILARFAKGGDIADVCTLDPPIGDVEIYDASLVVTVPDSVTYGTSERDYIDRQRQQGCTCEYRGLVVFGASDPPRIIRVDICGCPAHREATLDRMRKAAESKRSEELARRSLRWDWLPWRWAWLPWRGSHPVGDYGTTRTGSTNSVFHEYLDGGTDA